MRLGNLILALVLAGGCGDDSGGTSRDGGGGDGGNLVCYDGLESIALSPADASPRTIGHLT